MIYSEYSIIQNDCNQWLSGSFRVHQISFRPELHPGPHWGSLQRSPDPLAGLRDPISKGPEGERKGRGEGKRKKRGGTPPPFRKFLDPSMKCVKCASISTLCYCHLCAHRLFLYHRPTKRPLRRF